MTDSRLRPPLDAAVSALDELAIPYAIVGGLAVAAWGVVRSTKDVDLYAKLPASVRPKLLQKLVARDFDVPGMDEELQQFGVFRSLYRPTSVYLDIFDALNPLGEAVLEQRQEVMVQGKLRWTAAAEALVILKTFSDRARDHEDVMKLLAVGGSKLDMAYIEKWVRELDRSIGGNEVSERLDRARREAERRVGPNAPQRRR